MPFTYRDKPKLADRFRGKSGEEILNELKSDINTQGRRMFFDPSSWSTRHSNSAFSRGFPFDDDRNRIDIRTYLDEIASQYPEFADQLKERPWNENFVDPSSNKIRTEARSDQNSEASSSNLNPSEAKEPPQTLSNFGLRNTVPLGPTANLEQDQRPRSMSAPPENKGDNKTKRFVTKCEIPIMNNPTEETVQMKPDLTGRGSQEPPQQKPNNAPNVRVIPIQVEGRDTPLVNTNIDTSTNFGGETFAEPSFEGRLPRDFGTYQRHSPRFARKDRAPSPQFQYAPQYQHYVPPSQHFMPPQFVPQQHFAPPEQQSFGQQRQHPQKPPAPPPPPQQQHHHQQQQQHQHQQQQQQKQQQEQQQASKILQGDEPDSKPPPPKPEPVKDPLQKVQAIQKEVEELMRQVEAFKGNSRTDKQYLMLDELLTRQLLQLDVIETEGKENVRQARKDTIRSIQRCISTLENKVPLLETNEATSEQTVEQEETSATEPKAQQTMNVDNTKENTPVDNKESKKMDVDASVNSELQQNHQEQQQQPQAQEQQPQEEQNKDEKKKN